MIRINHPTWLDIEATNGPWGARLQVQHIHAVSLQPIISDGQPLEEGGVVSVALLNSKHDLVFPTIEEAQAEYARIMRVLDGDEQEVH